MTSRKVRFFFIAATGLMLGVLWREVLRNPPEPVIARSSAQAGLSAQGGSRQLGIGRPTIPTAPRARTAPVEASRPEEKKTFRDRLEVRRSLFSHDGEADVRHAFRRVQIVET